MALDFKTPSTIAAEYRQYIKTLKPSVNVEQKDSDWWIKSQAIGGTLSGVYGDQMKVNKDTFPQSARRAALVNHLKTYDLGDPIEAQQAVGQIGVTGDVGTIYTSGTIFQYDANGNTYTVDSTTTLAATAGVVDVTSVNAGQDQNLEAGTVMSMPSPPVGHESAQVLTMTDGRNDETDAEIAARVLTRIRQPIEGGNETDYEQWAFEASPSVTSSSVVRYPFGLGTVGVYITAGTTDIDAAIDSGQPIIRTPSEDLLETVRAYIDDINPATDCVTAIAPNEVEQDVTVRVSFKSGTGATIPDGSTLTQSELVEREVERALYKMPTGGRKIGATGFVLASEIEEALDSRLSASPYAEGSDFQILADRQVDDLSASGANRTILSSELVKPGSITIIEV